MSRWSEIGYKWNTEATCRVRAFLKENHIPFRMPSDDMFFQSTVFLPHRDRIWEIRVRKKDLARALRAGPLARLTDSKKLAAAERDELFSAIAETQGVEWALGLASPAEIDRLNILRATHLAMRRALEGLPGGVPAKALVDGLPVRGLPCPQEAVVKGDARSFLVAAASVVAKVSRDRIMDELDARHPGYGFSEHKGYPTPAHLDALRRLGASPCHRRSFGPVRAVVEPGLF